MDSKTKKDFQELFDVGFQKAREELKVDMIRVFNQGFEEVVLPELEEIRGDVKRLDGRVNGLENSMDRVERKLDVFSAKVIVQDARLSKIESVPAVAHALRVKNKAGR